MGCMSASDAAPLPRLGEVYFDVRGESRSMRLSWYADTGVAVFSIWQGGTCTGTFRLPIADLPRMVAALQRGPHGREDPGTAEPAVTGDRTGHARGPRPELLDSDVETGQTTAAIYLPPVTGNPDAYPDEPLAPGYRGEPMPSGYPGEPPDPGYRSDPLGARGRPSSADLGPPGLPEYPGGGGYGTGPAASGPHEYPGEPPAAPLAPEYHAEPPAAYQAEAPRHRRRRERPAPEYREDPDFRDDPRAAYPGPGAGYRSDPPGGYRDEPPAPGYGSEPPGGYRKGPPEPGYRGEPPGGYPDATPEPGYRGDARGAYPDAPQAPGYAGEATAAFSGDLLAPRHGEVPGGYPGEATGGRHAGEQADRGYPGQPQGGEYPAGPDAYPGDLPAYPEEPDPYGSPARPYVAGPPPAADEAPGSGRAARRQPRGRRGSEPAAESFPYGAPQGGRDPGNRGPGSREPRQRGRYR